MLRRERDTGGTAAAGASPLHHALLDEDASSLAYSNILHARELQQAPAFSSLSRDHNRLIKRSLRGFHPLDLAETGSMQRLV